MKIRILSILLALSLIISLIDVPIDNTASAEEQQQTSLTKDMVIERFGVAEEFINDELMSGLTLNHIYSILFIAETDGITYVDAKFKAFAPEVNQSQSAVGEVENINLPIDLIRRDPNTPVAGQVYEVDKMEPEFPIEEPVETDIESGEQESAPVEQETGLQEDSAPEISEQEAEQTEPISENPEQGTNQSEPVTENPYYETAPTESGIEEYRQTEQEEQAVEETQALASEPIPITEDPPTYNKNSISQAPYSVSLANENISSLSGSLTTEATDMTLPGRNGLTFSLTRQYNSDDAAFFDMNHAVEYFPATLYYYNVSYNAEIKESRHDIMYKEKSYLQYDFNGDGVPDENGFIAGQKDLVYNTHNTREEAQQAYIQGVYYTTPEENRTETTYRTNSTGNFGTYVTYNQGGFSGNLWKTGSAYVISGSYSPSDSRTEKKSCTNTLPGRYDANGQWYSTGDYTNPCPSSYSYSSGGYSGTLNRLGDAAIVKACASPGTPGWICTREWRADYSGTVTKPAVDTRIWEQKYQGTVTKPASTGQSKASSWRLVGGTYERVYYEIISTWIQDIEGPTELITDFTKDYPYYEDAVAQLNLINSLAGKVFQYEGYTYTISSTPNARINSVEVGTTTGYKYVNETVQPINEKKYPIGKGWSWKLPYVEVENGKQTVYLADGGAYEVENGTLKDYTWLGTTFREDTSVSVNGETSKYVLSTVDVTIKQYFTSDGRLLQIKDAYNNVINFSYAQHTTYGQKLLSQITDSIGNTISITYTNTQVTLAKGNETVTYEKRTENGKELLGSVVDQEGRRTTYSYTIAPAKFNLMGNDDSRAKSNPYALLTKVHHPTGAITEYTYETSPVKRYIGASSFKEAYRVASRADRLNYADGSSILNNYHIISYSGDFMQSHGQSYNFSTTLNNGLTNTVFNYKKEYVNESQPTQYYLASQTVSAEGIQKTTMNSYTKKVGTRNYAVPYPTTVVSSDNQTTDTLTSTVQYDDYGNIISAVEPSGATVMNTYDENKKWLVSSLQQVDTNQYLYTQYVRNDKGDIIETIVRKNSETGEVLSQNTQGAIDDFGNVTLVTVANGNKPQTYTIAYDPTHHAYPVSQSVNVTDADGVTSTITTQYEYDPTSGRMTAFTDGKGAQTTYAFDKLGRVLTVVNPDNTSIEAVYDDLLNTVTVTDEMGRRSRTTYNGLGWKVEEGLFGEDGYETRVKTGYDTHGRAIWIEDANGNRTQNGYDAWSRPTKSIAADLAESTINYNDALREVVSTDAVGNTIVETLDKFGRSVRTEEQLEDSSRNILSQSTYNPMNGLLLQQSDANQATTIYDYNILGQLTAVTNAKGEKTQYAYDQLGQHVKTIFPDGNETLKVYDEFGHLINSIDSKKLKDSYYYDANGNRSKLVDKKGQIFTYTYNDRNMLLEKQGPSETIAFTYLNDGTRKTMTDGTGTTYYTYDHFTGELTAVTYPDSKSIQYEYNNLGQRVGMTTPFGDEVTYSYNNVSQLKDLSWNNEVQASYQYLANGQLQKETKAGELTTEYTYSTGSLVNLSHLNTAGSYDRDYDYGYDLNRNIISIAEKNLGQVTRDDDFTYDQLSRIETSTQFNETYVYDNRGNRQMMMSDSGISPSDNMSYEYDEWDRLTKVVRADGTIVTYRYNGDNLMVERSDNGETTRYYYDGQQVIAEGIVQEEDGSVVEKVSYLRGSRLAMLEEANGTKGYYTHNGHGDVVSILDNQGQVLNSYEYDIWGKPLEISETVENSFLYSGEFWDETTELQYLRARWYDPGMGRFINEDTYEGNLGNPLSQNLYTYVHNNPLIYIDPSGNWCESADKQWRHPGACNDPSSTYSDDMANDGNWTLFDGKGGAEYHYPIDFRYARWKAGDVAAFEGASQSDKEKLRKMAMSDWTGADAVKYFSAGVITGFVLMSPGSGLLAMEVATTGTFTYNATTFASGTAVLVNILKKGKSTPSIPALNQLAQQSVSVNRPITGIIRADGSIEAHLQNTSYSINHKGLGLTKNDLGFSIGKSEDGWFVRGSGYATSPDNNWRTPSESEIEYIKALFGVK